MKMKVVGSVLVFAANIFFRMSVSSVELTPGDILVTDDRDRTGGAARVVHVNAQTGVQTVLLEGSPLAAPYGIALESPSRAVIADYGAHAIIRLDLSSSSASVLSSGGNLVQPVGIAVSGSVILVVDMSAGLVLRIDPVSGSQTIVSSGFSQLRGIAVETSGKIVVSDAGRNAVVRVDPSLADGANQSVLSSGGLFQGLKGIAVDCDGSIYVAGGSGIIRVDPLTGNQTKIISTGNGLVFPYTAEPNLNGKLILADPAGAPTYGSLFSLDLATTTLTRLALDRPLLESPLDIAIVGVSSHCVCQRFTVSDFAEPMGKAKKVGSTLPVKFRLFYQGTETTSQQQLDSALLAAGAAARCPEIRIYDISSSAAGIRLQEDLVPGNVGDVDQGSCFRVADSGWLYNLRLDQSFRSGATYRVEVTIGACVLTPANNLFQTK